MVLSSICCLWTFAKIDGFLRDKCNANSCRRWANAAYSFLTLALLLILGWSFFYGNKADNITDAIIKSKVGVNLISPNLDLQFVTASLNNDSYEVLWIDAKTQNKWRVALSKEEKVTKIDKL